MLTVKLRQMGTYGLQNKWAKGVLPWLIRWSRRDGT
jgi:hypothetical protein